MGNETKWGVLAQTSVTSKAATETKNDFTKCFTFYKTNTFFTPFLLERAIEIQRHYKFFNASLTICSTDPSPFAERTLSTAFSELFFAKPSVSNAINASSLVLF